MRILYRIVGFGALLVLLPLVGACVGALQPTACSAGAAAGDWIGEDFWVRADLARVQRELACGANVHAQDFLGDTPLHSARFNENAAVTEALLNAGADVHAQNDDGNTPLEWAEIAGNETAIELLQGER